MEQENKEIFDTAFDVAIIAAAETGPEGEIALTIVKSIFDIFVHAPEPEPVSEVIDRVVKSAFLDEKIKNGIVDFNNVYKWFSGGMKSYQKTWDEIKHPSDDFNKFLDILDDTLEPTSPVLRFIGLLELEGPINPTLEFDANHEKSFDIWMLGVSTHLMIRKFHLLVQKEKDGKLRSLTSLLDALNKYIEDGWKNSMAQDYLNIFPYLEDRMKEISPGVLGNPDGYDAWWNDPYQSWGSYDPGNKGGLYEATGFLGAHTHFAEAWRAYRVYKARRVYEWERFYKIAKTLNAWSFMYMKYAQMYNEQFRSEGSLDNYTLDKHPIYKHPVAYKKMNFSAEDCYVFWTGQTEGLELQGMMEYASMNGSYGFAYDPKSKVGWIITEEFPEDCKDTPLNNLLPDIYLPF